MGTVHAKEPHPSMTSFNESNSKTESPHQQTVDLHQVGARVDKIHIDGLSRTKDDIIKAQVSELFKAKDFHDVIQSAHQVRSRLEALGCFKNIGVFIDTSVGPDATPDGVEVTFNVNELNRLSGGVNTMVGNNEGSLQIHAKAPNVFGRGERLQMEYSYGHKCSTNVNIAAIKPFVDSRLHKVLTANVFSTGTDVPWSGYKEKNKGFMIDLAVNPGGAGSLKHNFQYEAAYREITSFKQASFFVREQSGPSLKSALRYICSIDKRNEKIFPTVGSLIKLTAEVAGLGGDIGFVKNEFTMQNNWSPHEWLTFQLGAQAGFLRGISNDMRVSITDQFFLGGPMNLRGFEMRGCGPRDDGNAIGGDIYWALALHVYTPLPFRPGKNSFGELFRLHGFVNGGNLGNFSSTKDGDLNESMKIFTDNVRCTAGGGIVMKFANQARVELNMAVPLLFARSDVLHQFQFGIGIHYL
ncbi:sorting and assembly machinery component 50 homolog [Venturia canescens]|uniref:sorting and assembly machinery component 50 homolog n=1 Tax=Venturia canescens TaxID=32260 RepID=UPI001C9CD578|nr:sorting and assembly machinery component 50 homolog [Venturia canescens]